MKIDLEKMNGILHANGMTYSEFQQMESLGKAWFVGERLVLKASKPENGKAVNEHDGE